MAFNWKPPQKPLMGRAQTSMRCCKSCGSTDMVDNDTTGDRACARCGVVQQENGIVSTVQFSESGGSSNVVGQFVSGDKGRPSGGGAGRGRGRFGHSRDSRESTIQNGKKKIIQVPPEFHIIYTLTSAQQTALPAVGGRQSSRTQVWRMCVQLTQCLSCCCCCCCR